MKCLFYKSFGMQIVTIIKNKSLNGQSNQGIYIRALLPKLLYGLIPRPRPVLAQGLKLLYYLQYTYFRKNCVQIRKSRTTTQMESCKTGQQSVHVVKSSSSIQCQREQAYTQFCLHYLSKGRKQSRGPDSHGGRVFVMLSFLVSQARLSLFLSESLACETRKESMTKYVHTLYFFDLLLVLVILLEFPHLAYISQRCISDVLA